MASLDQLRPHEIPGKVRFENGAGGLPKAVVVTSGSQAEIYLHGAQVTHYQRPGEAPWLFLSQASRFEAGKAIRGGVPICFPWFGPRPGEVAHGFARISDWAVTKTFARPDGGVTLRFQLPPDIGRPESALVAEFEVNVTDRLEMELLVTNASPDQTLEFEECLHTYFSVGDVAEISIRGLEGALYVDKTKHPSPERCTEGPIQITGQTDRTYVQTTSTVLIQDPILARTLRIEKFGSASTVVWNPWTTQVLADLGPDEYRRMVCVESGNVERDRRVLQPGERSSLKVILSRR